MKSIRSLLPACLLLFLSANLLSQPDFKSLDKVYGLNPLLHNGIKYTFYLPPGTGSHQYLQSPDYFTGSVTIKEVTFEGITLNYDIYNQQLLLKYMDEKGAFNIIEVSKSWLKEFHLGNKYFIYMDFGNGKNFYQVLGKNRVKLLYHWFKFLKLDMGTNSGNFTFTPAIKSSYILKDNELRPFRNKRGLIEILGQQHKKEIKRFMRQNGIKLKKASEEEMTELINYLGDL